MRLRMKYISYLLLVPRIYVCVYQWAWEGLCVCVLVCRCVCVGMTRRSRCWCHLSPPGGRVSRSHTTHTHTHIVWACVCVCVSHSVCARAKFKSVVADTPHRWDVCVHALARHKYVHVHVSACTRSRVLFQQQPSWEDTTAYRYGNVLLAGRNLRIKRLTSWIWAVCFDLEGSFQVENQQVGVDILYLHILCNK